MSSVREAAPALGAGIRAPTQEWSPLRYFNLYRFIISGLFLGLILSGLAPKSLGLFDPRMFAVVTVLYFLFSLISGLCVHTRRPAFDTQVVVQVFADIMAITLMMHASGGVASGFGILLMAAVAGGSLLAAGRVAVLFAAMASIAVLAEEISMLHRTGYPDPNYPHAGMLGLSFFAAAYLSFLSAKRIRASEALAARREVDLANLAQLNEHIIRRMQSGILAIDPEGRIRLINESAQRLLGLPPGSVGRPMEGESPKLAALLARWHGEDRSRSSHLMGVDAVHGEVVVSFAELGRASADGVLVFVEDASAMTQRAQQLKLASLGRLTASIAHEIRNPLGAISHAGQLLEESPELPSGDRRLTAMIRHNSQRVNAIIENVLQLSRRKPAAPESLAVAPWLEQFVQGYTETTRVDRRSFRVRVEPDDLHVRIDPSQLNQVLHNLCDNALEHAEGAPGVELHAGVGAETERPYLDVIDHGAGISPEAAEHVFEPFFTTRVNGTGLGLYLARELCEANLASLSLIPSGKGCHFRITFVHPLRQGVPIP